jgi:4-amino-4-deoxy-L-arabinose transferase-like glycosyltransferase
MVSARCASHDRHVRSWLLTAIPPIAWIRRRRPPRQEIHQDSPSKLNDGALSAEFYSMSRRNFIPLLLVGVIVLDFAWLALWMDYNAYWGRLAQPGNVCHCGTPAVVNRTHRDISFAVSCPALIAG